MSFQMFFQIEVLDIIVLQQKKKKHTNLYTSKTGSFQILLSKWSQSFQTHLKKTKKKTKKNKNKARAKTTLFFFGGGGYKR